MYRYTFINCLQMAFFGIIYYQNQLKYYVFLKNNCPAKGCCGIAFIEKIITTVSNKTFFKFRKKLKDR